MDITPYTCRNSHQYAPMLHAGSEKAWTTIGLNVTSFLTVWGFETADSPQIHVTLYRTLFIHSMSSENMIS